MAATSAEFIPQVVFKTALGTGGKELIPAFPAELAGPLIFGLTLGAFYRG